MLVGRARHQAGALSAELKKLGAEVVEIPFIQIRKPKSFKPLDAALKNLDTYDWLILTSVNGVEAMWARMQELQNRLRKVREGHDFSRAVKAFKTNSALAAGAHASPPSAPPPRRRSSSAGCKSMSFRRNMSRSRSCEA